MLVYRMPVPNEWVYSLKEVSLSKRNYEQNQALRTRYCQLKNAGKPCRWPPKDDPYASLRFGWAVPKLAYSNAQALDHLHGEHIYAHQLGVAFQQSPLINNCLAYIYNDYAKRHPKEWERVQGEFSYRMVRMDPEEFLFQKIRRAISQLLPELRGNNVYDHPIFRDSNDTTWDDIVKTFLFYLPWMAKWCLHSYTLYPEDWTEARGEYQEISIFKKGIPVPEFKIDTMSPEIMAAMDASKPSSQVKEKRKVVKQKEKHSEEQIPTSWLDNEDHAFDLRHEEE